MRTAQSHRKKSFRSASDHRFGLKGKLLAGILIPTVVILLLISGILQNSIGTIVKGMQNSNITNQAHSAEAQIISYFDTIFLSENMISQSGSVKLLIREMTTAPVPLRFEQSVHTPDVIQDLSTAKRIHGTDIQLLWIAGFQNNQVLQSSGEISDPAVISIVERPWYRQLMETGKPILTGAYEDSITGELVVSAISPIVSAQGSIIGAVGADIQLSEIQNILSRLTLGETGYLTVYDSDGNIVYHPDSALVLQNIGAIRYSENIQSILKANQNSDIIKYRLDQSDFYGKVSYLDQIGWTVLGCIPQREYDHEQIKVIIITTFGFLFCILSLVGICIAIANRMLKPVKSLTAVAPNLMKGQLKMDLPEITKDEIGVLVEIFGATARGMEDIITDISKTLEGIANKNLTVETTAEYRGEFIRIKNAIYHIINGMDTIMAGIIQSADQVSAGSDQVASGAQALAQGASEQAESVERLSASITQITDQIQKMSDTAQQASDEAKVVGDHMQTSSRKMDEMQTAMARINDASGEIEKIVKTIEDIAFQTNILALNAAVEAARAGNAGKGFAVVADEVRNLASKSAEASKTTTGLISNSLSAVREGMRLANETALALNTAVQGASNVVEQIHLVSDDLTLQSEAMGEIALGVGQISSVVQTNSATAEESAAASEELAAQSQALKDMVADFRLREKTCDPGTAFAESSPHTD